jgi:hypothetical protein
MLVAFSKPSATSEARRFVEMAVGPEPVSTTVVEVAEAAMPVEEVVVGAVHAASNATRSTDSAPKSARSA